MKLASITAALLNVILLAGCCPQRARTHLKRTVDQFAFVEVGMPMTVVRDRVGMPDLPYRGQIRWRYALADGSEVAIAAEADRPPYSIETWRVIWVGQERDDQWLWVRPPELLK